MKLVQEFIVRFRGSEFAKNTAILTLGTIVAQGVTMTAMPILSRLYTPADFGMLAVFMAVSGIVGTVITLRFDAAILLPKDEIESMVLVLLSGILAVAFGTLIVIIAGLMPDSLKSKLGILVLDNWLMPAILSGIAAALMSIASNWYNRKSDYIKISILRVTHSIAGVFLGISLFFFGYHDGLIFAQMVASLIVAFIVLFSFGKIHVNWKTNDFRSIFKKHSDCPKYLLPTSLLDVLTLQLPILLITTWFSSEAAGQFTMAWKILAIPSALIGAAIGQVFFQRFSATWPDVQLAKSLLFRTWKILALVGLFPIILLALFGESLFGLVLGEAWRGAGKMATILAPMLFAILISSPTSGIYLVLKLQKISLYFGISFFIYRAGAIYVGFVFEDILIGLACWVICEIIAIAVYNLIALRRMNSP